jgi:hypothetical protein
MQTHLLLSVAPARKRPRGLFAQLHCLVVREHLSLGARGALGFTAAIVAAVACGSSRSSSQDGGAPPPPAICNTPSGPHPMPWFQDVTADVGLAPSGSFVPHASSVVSGDFDNDGWSDLVATASSSERGAPTSGPAMGQPVRLLLMNRPSPTDPSSRVFVDATAASGLLATRDGANDRGWGVTNVGDVDNDGNVDVILCPADEINTTPPNPQDPCDAFLGDGQGHFTLAATSDLDGKVFWVPGAALLDYDHDGNLDFWPSTVAHWPYDPYGPNRMPPTLFRGNGDGTFQNVSGNVGLPTADGSVQDGTQWRHVFGNVACDLDGDGYDEMIFADYGREENQVWRFDGTRFTNVAHAWGVDYDDRMDYSDDQSWRCYCDNSPQMACSPDPPAPAMNCCDFCQQDGLACPSTSCPAWLRWDPGTSGEVWGLGGNYFSMACGDINDDGQLDLVSATIVHGDVGSSEDPTEIILNPGGLTPQGPAFTRPGNQATGLYIPETGYYWNHGDDMMVMVDVDLDGRKDLFVTTTGAYEATDTHRLWHQKDDGTFEEIEQPAGLLPTTNLPNLHGPAFVDIDGDGDLDLVAGDNSSSQVLHVFRNLAGQDNNWLRVRLIGAGPGAGGASVSAIGARISVTAGGRTQTQYVSGGYGHGNVQADLVLTFGLGSSCTVDSVEVRWPDVTGSVSSFTEVSPNYTATITQGSQTIQYTSFAP